VTVTFDKSTNRATKSEITPNLEDGLATIILAYDQLRDGPSYPAKTVITSAAEQLENADLYLRLPPIAAT